LVASFLPYPCAEKVTTGILERPWEQGKAPPVALVLSALCDTRDISFVMAATSVFHSANTQDFLRSIRVTP
jgi:hypothetical protein